MTADCAVFITVAAGRAKEPYKNNLYIFALLPNAFVFAGSLHT